ncbi:MAG TPA: hypothetical protein VFA04_21215 [Bryobacteraceae bacterium]|nr:hypothetical protein [Bryobacteraceae bacterium]
MIKALLFATLAVSAIAQDAAPAKFYKLDFVVREVEGGHVLNARQYSTVVITGEKTPTAVIQTGSKVPFQSSPSSIQYADVGVNIDCDRVLEQGSDLSLSVSADISSVPESISGSITAAPVVRQNKWRSNVLVPIRKPSVVFTADDTSSRRQMQLEVTATPMR